MNDVKSIIMDEEATFANSILDITSSEALKNNDSRKRRNQGPETRSGNKCFLSPEEGIKNFMDHLRHDADEICHSPRKARRCHVRDDDEESDILTGKTLFPIRSSNGRPPKDVEIKKNHECTEVEFIKEIKASADVKTNGLTPKKKVEILRNSTPSKIEREDNGTESPLINKVQFSSSKNRLTPQKLMAETLKCLKLGVQNRTRSTASARRRLDDDYSDTPSSSCKEKSSNVSESVSAAAMICSPSKKAHHWVMETRSDKHEKQKANQQKILRDEIANREEYFSRREDVLTSDHTLARLKNPIVDPENAPQSLENVSITHQKELTVLNKELLHLYHNWSSLLRANLNVMLYGIGSKTQCLNEFRKMHLSTKNSITINGFSPSSVLVQAFTSLIEDILEEKCTANHVPQQLQMINNIMRQKSCHVFVIIHSIDGVLLRTHKTQTWLSTLAAIPNMHVIASIDHVNAPLLWDHSKLGQFRWIWFDVSSYLTYTEETVCERSMFSRPSRDLLLSSLIYVYHSLNPKAQGIFKLIMNHQLENAETNNYLGIAYQDCYRKCSEEFLVTNDLTMRAQLTEFKDHSVINSKKGPDGVEYLKIPLDQKSLKAFKEHLS